MQMNADVRVHLYASVARLGSSWNGQATHGCLLQQNRSPGLMDVAGIIQTIAISLPPLLLALTLHELAHGYVALHFGDETARWAGRLTLNPIKHMDPLGTFFILFGMITRTPVIGWAKPVPVNPHNLRRPHTGMIWVALAGPAMNLLLAGASALAIKWFPGPSWWAASPL